MKDNTIRERAIKLARVFLNDCNSYEDIEVLVVALTEAVGEYESTIVRLISQDNMERNSETNVDWKAKAQLLINECNEKKKELDERDAEIASLKRRIEWFAERHGDVDLLKAEGRQKDNTIKKLRAAVNCMRMAERDTQDMLDRERKTNARLKKEIAALTDKSSEDSDDE